MRSTLCYWILVFGLAASSLASAQVTNDDLVCPDDDLQLDKYEYLRSLSLDVRGVVPTVDELIALDEERGVSLDLIDMWLDQPAFVEQAVRFHRQLVWPNVEGSQLFNAKTAFTKVDDLYYRKSLSTLYRGAVIPCRDEEEPDPENIVAEFQGDGVYLEGYVLINPYWAPETTIKVCAFDAQEKELASTGVLCGSRDGWTESSCGCGPNLRWCRYGALHQTVNRAFGKDLELRVAQVIEDDLSYIELFTNQRAWVNGPIVHFLKYQTPFHAGLSFEPLSYDVALLPDLTFMDEEFVPIVLSPEHVGILSSPAFLLRFQTNRARANRFYQAFKCKPFTAPEGGLAAVADEVAALEPDLQIRAGCSNCHSILEGAASHWGRWTQAGAGYLDSEIYPMVDEDCVLCALTGIPCSDSCEDFYLVNPLSPEEETFAGWLLAYVFRGEEQYANVEYGPHALVMKSIGDDTLPNCLTRTVVEWLFGREVANDEEAWVSEMAMEFVHSDFRFKDLVRAIVTSPAYRRIR